MDAIKKYSRFLELFCYCVVVPLIIISFFYKWFAGDIPVYNDITTYTKKVTVYTGLSFFYNSTSSIHFISIIARIFGAIIDAISVALLFVGCLYFARLVRYYQRDELFSANTLRLFNKMSRIAFAWTLYEPIKFTLLSIITTMAQPSGQRVITIGITSNDVVHIFIVGFFWIITFLMKEAYTLKKENDLTI